MYRRKTPNPNGSFDAALAHLRGADPVMARLIDVVGPCRLSPSRAYFVAMCESILAQQLATAAARTITSRFCGLFPRKRPTPEGLLALGDEALRAVGVSSQKIRYLRDLAAKFADGHIPTRRLAGLDDDAIIAALTEVKGVGVWTAQMFLIFVLNRPDVWAVDDYGLRRAIQLHYGRPELPTKAEMAEHGEPWRPYRSVASWYLWQSLAKAPPGDESKVEGPKAEVARAGARDQRSRIKDRSST
jgi:3-methyladenine DNA glycosylase/8-oxoguanine DNA glycosylase